MKTPVGLGTRTIITSQSYLLQPEENICFFNSAEKGRIKTLQGQSCISGTEKEGWKAGKNISSLTECKVNANQISRGEAQALKFKPKQGSLLLQMLAKVPLIL